MKIIFILEDNAAGVELKCLRMDVGDALSTPANSLAQEVEKVLMTHAGSAKKKALKLRTGQCLH